MSLKPTRRMDITWFCLTIATLVSVVLGRGSSVGDEMAGGLVLLVTYAKVRFVMREFMELSRAPHIMSIVSDVWIVSSLVLLIGLYAWGGTT